MDSDYKDLRKVINSELIQVTVLKKGCFEKFLRKQQALGAELAHWKPPHINPSDSIIIDLIDG
jgi:hypothetical protein